MRNNTSKHFLTQITAAFSLISPLFLSTVSLLLGIILGYTVYQEALSRTLIFIIFLSLYLISLIFDKRILFLLLMFGTMRILFQSYSYDQILFKKNEFITVEGIVTDISDSSQKRFKKSLLVQIHNMQGNDKTLYFYTTNYTIQIYTKEVDEIKVGDTIALYNIRLKKNNKASFKKYLIKENIITISFIENLSYKILESPPFSASRLIFNIKKKIYNTLKKKVTPSSFGFFSSLFLGNKNINKPYLERISNQFKQWGILHFLARSGLHLVIFILIWELVFSLMPFNFIIKQILLIVFSVIYFLLSWSSISFIRAFIIFLLAKWCILNKHPLHFMHILLLTCCIILFTNPMQLFFLDFQLSFLLTFGLNWISLNQYVKA